MFGRIVSVGSYLPRKVVDNDFFRDRLSSRYSEHLDDFFGGAQARHHASPDESCVVMGTAAARQALARAGLKSDAISHVLSYSPFPDEFVPSDGLSVMENLGIDRAPCLEIDAACGSFGAMLLHADALVRLGRARHVLILLMTNWIDRGIDRSRNYSCLGEGAAAVIVGPSEEPCLLSFREESRPRWKRALSVSFDWKESRTGLVRFETTDEYRSFFGGGEIVEPLREAMAEARRQGISPRWFVSHQPGMKVLDAWARALGFRDDQILSTFPFTGNMSSVNIPFIIDHYTSHRPVLKRGDVLALFSLGAGLYLNGMLWRY